MRIDVPPAGRVYTPGADDGLALVLRAARSHLLGMPDATLEGFAARLQRAPGGWEAALETAHRNRLSAFVLPGLKANGVDLPPAVLAALEQYRTETFRVNTRNLMTIRQIVPLIEAAGIEVAVIKGPLQQQLMYGEFFAKPAGDVDLLVRAGDFLRARAILIDAGYELPAECASPWWRMFLGEQHLLTASPSLSTIDLHHRVQQPGAPSPSDLSGYLARRQRVSMGASDAPALALRDALLLQCMSLVKALIHREPAGGYAADLVAGMRAMTVDDLAQFAHAAEGQGLRNTVRLALRGVEALFGAGWDIALPGEPRMLDHTTDDDLILMLVRPDAPNVVWTKRRRILWALNDAGPISFSREVAWAVGGEVTRRLFQAAPDEGGQAAPAATR